MSENLPKTLNCPACGAPLDFDGKSSVVRCIFCHNVSIVPGVLPEQAESPGASLDEIRRLAESKQIIKAIERYRQISGVGLKEAKDAVDALLAGRLVETPAAAEIRLPPEDLTRTLEEVKELLAAGKKIEAIKKYREAFDVSLARGKYAVEQIESGQTAWPEAGFPEQVAPAREVPAVKTKGWLACIIPLSILLFVGGIVLFGLSQPGGPINPFLLAGEPAILLSSNQDIPPDVVSEIYDVNKETRSIGLVNAANGKLRWKTEPLPGDGYVDAIAQSENLIYVASGTDLLAFQTSDGSPSWQAKMPDKLNYGENSLLVTAGRVLTLNVDQSLQAYDAESGGLVWSRRLAGYDRQLRLMGGSLVLLDYTGDSYTYSLFFLDPVDGREQRILSPTCQSDEYSSATLDTDSGIVYDETANALFLIFDSSPGCIQRLDLASGQVTWQTLGEGWYSFSPYGLSSLLTDDRLYFNNSNQLLAVDKSTGSLHTLLNNEDYEFLPLAVSGERLIVRARVTRGSERFELWGLDRQSGERLWKMDLENAKPVDPPNELVGLVDKEDTGWTWKLTPTGLLLLKFQGEPNQLILETINPDDGASLGEMTVKLKKVSGDFYSIPSVSGWHENLVYILLESKIYSLDVVTGELNFP